MWRRTNRTLSLLACALALCALPSTAMAGSYWWSGTPAAGSNNFSWQQTGGWSPWGGGSRCENSATTYGTGSYCQLVWNVPANLDALSGSIQGSYRQANANFEQQMFVEGNGTTILQGDTNTRTYNRQWPDMASYLYVRVINTGAATTTSAGTVWFDASSMTINLVDPYSPGPNILEGHSGWKGPSGACIRYGYGEAGSGLDATSLTDVNTGAVYDNPGYQTSAVTTGVFQNDRNCVGVPAPGTGTYTLRAAAVDKSGNYVSNDFAVSFDTTAPSLSAPSSGGSVVNDGRVFGSAGDYRPAFAWTIGDGHSGVAAITTRIDRAAVAHGYSGGTVTMTPASRMPLGNHTVSITVTDAVGNASTVTRTITIRDDVKPTLTIAAPGADGSNSPVLDVTASDDHAGVDPSSWRVMVNGVQMTVALGSARVQAEIGRLVNGTHQIDVSVADQAGNRFTHTISHVASSDARTPPGLHGVYVIAPPEEVTEAEVVRFSAAIVKAGRPQAGTRVELRRGTDTLTSAIVAADGFVELVARIDDPGDLTLHAEGTGLPARTIVFRFIPDTTAPTVRVDRPSASGDTSPTLDVTAFDTQSGVVPATWMVLVNGVELPTSSPDNRLLVALGRLVNGTHEIEVRIFDRRGNQRTEKLTYTASGDEHTPPGKNGIYVLTVPQTVDQGYAYRVTVVAVKDGRPLTTGRFEILRAGGDGEVLAGKLIGPDGYADILITDPPPGTMTLRLTGSTLPLVQYTYTYRKAGEPAFCRAHPEHASCTAQGGGDGSGTSGGTGTGTTGGGSGTGGTSAGTSGGPNDKVPPEVTLRRVFTKQGVVLRTKRLVLRVTSNERANYTIRPIGNRSAIKLSMRKQTRVLRIKLTGSLLRRIQKAKTPYVWVKVRVVGIDGNKNVTRTTITLRVRR